MSYLGDDDKENLCTYLMHDFFPTLKTDLFTYLCVCLSVSICACGGGMYVHMQARRLHHSLPVLSLNLGLWFSLSAPPRAGAGGIL